MGDDDSPSSSPPTSPQTKSRSTSPVKVPRSYVWNHFARTDSGPVCNYCKKKYSKNTSTTPMKSHLKVKHPSLVPELIQPTLHDVLSNPYTGKQKEELDDAMLDWIVEGFQSFSMVNKASFREFMHQVNPR